MSSTQAEPAGSPRRNRLANESSPYLLQHAGNPVDWYPWDDEALAKARAERKPIFLSIGYAACHWCHVMERESFEDATVAAFLNAHFVPVKVDRDERPDVDAVYMTAVQAMTGSGGWPLSVFLTPDLEPFFGGTYFPPERRWGRPSFLEVLEAVAATWEKDREHVAAQAAAITRQLTAAEGRVTGVRLDADRAASNALAALTRTYDLKWGGFGRAPKFPTPSRLFFLLELAAAGDAQACQMLGGTLDGMAAGGMWDWLGGGFHRYSVDEMWLVPHFEKMLFDNALLCRLYGEAGMRLDRPRWLAVARAIADYLLREMRGPEGGFYSSTDADSEGEEGRYFTWSEAEVRAALPAAEAEAVVVFFDLATGGNFEGGRSVLRPAVSVEHLAAKLSTDPGEARERIERARRLLLDARARRVPPALDDKRLAGWNGMAIWALAWLGSALEEARYVKAALRTGRLLLERFVRPDGRLVRSWREGRASGAETLEDVAWVTAALVELYQADGEVRWLAAALRLVDARLPAYRDPTGAVYGVPTDGEALPLRPRDPTDGAAPASVAVLIEALLRLAALSGREALAAAALRAAEADADLLDRAPHACASLVQAARLVSQPPSELVVVGEPSWDSTRAMRRAARRARRPATVLALSTAVPVPPDTVSLVPLFAGRERASGRRALAYLCEGGACRPPTDDPATLARALVADDSRATT